MKKPLPVCDNEAARLEALRQYRLLNTPPEEVYDDITRLAAFICGTKFSGITIIDQEIAWSKSKFGFSGGAGLPRELTFCNQVVLQNDTLVVDDSLLDERFANYHVVVSPPHLRFYAGVPLVMPDGHTLGTLCVFDTTPHHLTEDQQEALHALTRQVTAHFQRHRLTHVLADVNEKLASEIVERKLVEQAHQELIQALKDEKQLTRMMQELDRMKTNFLIVTSHEMRTPLTVIKGYAETLAEGYLGALNAVQQQSTETIVRMVDRLVGTFSDILEMLHINQGKMQLRPTEMDLALVIREVLRELSGFVEQRHQAIEMTGPDSLVLVADRDKLFLVLMNVIQNAIKFSFDEGRIQVDFNRQGETIHLTITDNGIGIEPNELERIFELFYTTTNTLTHKSGRYEFSARGSGLGLALAKNYVEAHEGYIWAESEGQNQGSRLRIVLPVAGPKEN
ncbi:MAG: GAF domain-containing sensor histidine kinase [Blastocatellia bacterium]|nr:GAF domain-containing sensor histidine kinase [Blastocatellia bacterium]